MDDLIQEFIAETRETLAALSNEIVAWEADPTDRARLDAIFRFVHTVKGSCGFLDLPRLARLSHAAEDGLQAVRDGTRVPDSRFVDAVLAIVDRIGDLVEAIASGSALSDSDDEDMIRALSAETVVAPVAAVAVEAQASRGRAPSRSVRLSVDLLDRMMGGMSDLVLVRNELARRLRETNPDPAVEAALERLSATVGELRDTVSRTRMQKLDALFGQLPRMVRDTAADLGKAVSLSIEGGDVELDREMIEMVRDPLTHILRNAIDHGLEAPADRRAAGKREEGRIRISALQAGNQIEISISDDGRGIDTARLVQRMVAKGEIDAAQAGRLDEAARLELIFRPGASTAERVTELSGRGVGMDVVRANVERIGGVVDLRNAPGHGLRVTLRVPLTLSIIAAISFNAGDCSFALPRSGIEEIVALSSPLLALDQIGDAIIARLRDQALPVVDLGALIAGEEPRCRREGVLCVVRCSGGSFAILADGVGDHEELVIKPAAPQVMAAGIYAGEALPDSGLPLLVLDLSGLAAAGGISFDPVEFAPARDAAANVEAATMRDHLVYRCLAGQRRIVPLALVAHIVALPMGELSAVGGDWFARIDGKLMPLAQAPEPMPHRDCQLLVLSDGTRQACLAVAEAQEIVALPADLAPVRGPDGQAVVLIDEAPVAVVDAFALLASAGGASGGRRCVLVEDGADGWMQTVLRPLLLAAGYEVVAGDPASDDDVVIVAQDRVHPNGKVVALRDRLEPAGANDASVYRYDRAGILSAIDRLAAGGR